jgi:hypothetical protein
MTLKIKIRTAVGNKWNANPGLHKGQIKWPILSQTSTEGSGKNKKSGFLLLGLKYTLRTCFDAINFLPKSCPELSN